MHANNCQVLESTSPLPQFEWFDKAFSYVPLCPQCLTEMYSCVGTGEGCFIMPVLSLNNAPTEKQCAKWKPYTDRVFVTEEKTVL